MCAVVYAVPGVIQLHMMLTAIYSTRLGLHYMLPIKISMQFPVVEKC